MLKLNFGVTSKEHYGMLWYFLEWSISITPRFKQDEPDDGQKHGLILVQRGNETWNCFSMRVLLLSWRFCFLSRYLTVLLGKVMYTGQNRSETSQKNPEIKTFNIYAVGITKVSGKSYHNCII